MCEACRNRRPTRINRHKNARTTPYGRALMVQRVRELGWSAARGGRGRGRERAHGAQMARPPSRRRGGSGCSIARRDRATLPPRIAEGWQTLIVRLRQCRMTGAEIASRLHLARSTVAAELVRLGLNRLSALAPKEPVRRYERAPTGRSGPPRRQEARPLRQARPSRHPNPARPERRRRLGVRPRLHRRPCQARLCRGPRRRGRRQLRALPRPGRRLVRPPWHLRAARHDRQRRRLPQPSLPPGLPGARPAPPADPALHAQDQRQGRALHQDHARGLGLRRAVPLFLQPAPPAAGLAAPLQPRASPTAASPACHPPRASQPR